MPNVEPDFTDALGVRVHPWTRARTIAAIEASVETRQYMTHTQLNVAKWVAAYRDPAYRALISRFSIINVDGMGLLWGARFIGVHIPERVAGIDLFTSLVGLAANKGWRVFLLGGTPEVVTAAAANFRTRYPTLTIGHHHGYFWGNEDALATQISTFHPDLVFVGITSPKQEEFIDHWGPRLGAPFLMAVGGSFDVISGSKSRAPVWVQKIGLEWFYRLAQEPRRLAWRYISTNLQFACYLITRKFMTRRRPR